MKTPLVVAPLLVLAVAVTGCAAKQSTSPASSTAGGLRVTVDANDSTCVPAPAEGLTGPTTFVVTNTGTKVTEFYVYGTDNKVLGEVENISPGLKRELAIQFDQPGTYRLACKPGMVGDGISVDFAVKA